MDQEVVQRAVLDLFQQGVGNVDLLHAVAWGLSMRGKTRPAIVTFFWELMDRFEGELPAPALDTIGDFCHDLLGRGPLDHIVRLHGDPDDPRALGEKVSREVRGWKPPT